MSNPLTWSGINYILVPTSHPDYNILQGNRMVDSANPFSQLAIDTVDHASLSLYERLVFTNRVFMGKHFDWSITGQGCKGILDLFIFPLVSRVLLYHAIKLSTPRAVKLGAIAVGYPLEFARRVVSIALTIAVSPLVLLVHLAFKIKNTLSPSALNQNRLLAKGKPESKNTPDNTDNYQRSVITGVRVT